MSGSGLRYVFARTLFRHGWDTRSRSLLPARALRPLLDRLAIERFSVLDVGCGPFGLAAFLPGVSAVGLDAQVFEGVGRRLPFVCGSATALPFRARSFPIVTCIDVLEHLGSEDRAHAVEEIVRVADRAVLLACPHGATARQCDEVYLRAREERGQIVPEWLIEHRRHAYPTGSELIELLDRAANRMGRAASVSLSYGEPARVCRLLRATAARSDGLFVALSLLFGVFFDIFPAPQVDTSYRVMLLADISPPIPREGVFTTEIACK